MEQNFLTNVNAFQMKTEILLVEEAAAVKYRFLWKKPSKLILII